jgi:cytochrome b6-f complex iron-sulfur subunit
LRNLQFVMGGAFLLSSAAGVYLLATDNSLWLLSISHALGLIVIVLVEGLLGILNLRSVRGVYLPSIAGALLALLLQLGDIFTAPQYNMTIQYFATYLFGLWSFDTILLLQGVVIVAGLYGRSYAQHLAKRRTRLGPELSYSKRSFMRSIVLFGGLVAGAVALGSVKLPSASAPSSVQTATTAQGGSIGNMKDFQVGSPVYFEYPAGYPNILVKKTDGSVVAMSILCTHVCCQCEYDSVQLVIVCPCHGSVFDISGKVLQGPAAYPLPQVTLRTDGTGNVFPTSITGASPCLQL